ncbi:MAG: hypothetical protein PHR53_05835 [Bacteroidales bacterium]|nr:hypothetical protein [Bacteroidales bacterium]
MKILRIIIAILLLPVIVGFGEQILTLRHQFQWTGTQPWFWGAFVGTMLLLAFFLPQSSYISILKHELVHNLFALLTFKKPQGIHVDSGKGGEFSFSGSSNPFIVLSPYFFPLITAFLLLIFLLGLKNMKLFFLFFGVAAAFDMMTAIKDTHWQQPDLKKYGRFFSLLFVATFWIFNWGFIVSFVMNAGFSNSTVFVIEGGQKVVQIFQWIIQFFSS